MGSMKDLLGDKPPPWANHRGEPVARRTDPETSHAAAARIKPIAGTDRERVLRAHARCPEGLSDYELADILERQQNSVGKRRTELRDAGLIEATDMRRLAPSGSKAIVWRITERGRAALFDIERADR